MNEDQAPAPNPTTEQVRDDRLEDAAPAEALEVARADRLEVSIATEQSILRLLRTIRALCVALLVVMVVFGTSSLVLSRTISDVRQNSQSIRASCDRENASNKRQVLLWEGLIILNQQEPPPNEALLVRLRALLASTYPQTDCAKTPPN